MGTNVLKIFTVFLFALPQLQHIDETDERLGCQVLTSYLTSSVFNTLPSPRLVPTPLYQIHSKRKKNMSITTAKRAFFFVHTAGPNTALIKSSGRRNMRVVIGGRMFSIPGMDRVDTLSLELRTITVFTKGGLTINGVSVDVTSACQVKIQGWTSEADATGGTKPDSTPRPSFGLSGQNGTVRLDEGAIRLAAQHFLGKSDQEMEDCIQATISGHQRSIIGCLTLEQLYRDRAAFCKRVLELISVDMRNMGLAVVSYTVADITDDNGYIDALGVTQTEAVKREAVEGAARNQSAAKSMQAQQEAAAHIEVNLQIRRKIESDLQLQLQQAKAQEMIQRQTAVQSKAHDISDAEQDAILLVTRQKAAAAETEAQLEVIRQEVEKEKLMKMKAVNVEADAMLYRAKLTADCTSATTAADAQRVRELGKAEAESIRQKGLAEVEVLRFRNRAWQES